MSQIDAIPQAAQADASQSVCPFDHTQRSQQKTAKVVEPTTPALEKDQLGTWHIRGFAEARAVLRSSDTKQAGFNAEFLEKLPQMMKHPILYLEGKDHQQQRKQTARFFTPKTVSTHYRELMEQLTDQLLLQLQQKKRVDLSQLSLKMAVRVASEIVGLTNSRLSGLTKRLEAFFQAQGHALPKTFIGRLMMLTNQRRTLAFYLFDVLPAIRARKRQPQEDVISHLLANDYKNSEILTECVTYAAAGMVTTREFISVATWHILERPDVRKQYLAAPEAERHEMLKEILRLEPVVSHLYRRATADIQIESADASVVIPQGTLIDLHIHGTNADETIVKEHPRELCPGRAIAGDRVPAEIMGFGDGHHRCPGSFVAIQEADIFLHKLLALDTLRIEQTPVVKWNDMIESYEIRNFIIAL